MKRRRTTFRKVKSTKNGSGMVAGGWGRDGPYTYVGAKKGKASAGFSVGTRGRELHASHRTKGGRIKGRYNLDSKRVTVRRSRRGWGSLD